jgi:hypothetical protein
VTLTALVSLATAGSKTPASATCALGVSVPAPAATVLTVIVADATGASAPSVHVSVWPLAEQLPCEAVLV